MLGAHCSRAAASPNDCTKGTLIGSLAASVARRGACPRQARVANASTPTDPAFVDLLKGLFAARAAWGVATRLPSDCSKGVEPISVPWRGESSRAKMICFGWRGELWFPMLQFDGVDMSFAARDGRKWPPSWRGSSTAGSSAAGWPRRIPRSTIARRSTSLESNPGAVLQAARLDRFLARG